MGDRWGIRVRDEVFEEVERGEKMKVRKVKKIIRLYKRQMKENYGISIIYAKWSKRQLEYMKLLLKPELLEIPFEDIKTIHIGNLLTRGE